MQAAEQLIARLPPSGPVPVPAPEPPKQDDVSAAVRYERQPCRTPAGCVEERAKYSATVNTPQGIAPPRRPVGTDELTPRTSPEPP
ncbi:hypothetical protein DL764_003394 [Monosporascus ibericus]|uniref:Uncharacterized protein n=1 Tax=Monosporascus ibericus TaxID=155417 RepID=A0A4Q4TGN0_9PEZI|nr:hypothetical protein DL764_003394 [Monosporascus ibericus]